MAYSSKRHVQTDARSGTDPRTAHPMRLMLWFALAGISVLFLGLVSAFMSSGGNLIPELRPPLAFLVSTALIATCSITLVLASVAFGKEQRKPYRFWLVLTALLGFSFIIAQSLGWSALHQSGIDLRSHASGSYLYLISAMHAMHVLMGLVFMGLFASRALHLSSHPAIALVHFSDPAARTHLGLLGLYWHFMAGIWGVLMGVFLWVTG